MLLETGSSNILVMNSGNSGFKSMCMIDVTSDQLPFLCKASVSANSGAMDEREVEGERSAHDGFDGVTGGNDLPTSSPALRRAFVVLDAVGNNDKGSIRLAIEM
jgi:hypothetical protein